jgi:hypothetical protein
MRTKDNKSETFLYARLKRSKFNRPTDGFVGALHVSCLEIQDRPLIMPTCIKRPVCYNLFGPIQMPLLCRRVEQLIR